ncbi:hypothetical protein FJY70_03440, partial [candidate division WOR-3 bacterium]|nr:hypothetical protein [candidate division WOR-3 bacterium]
MPSSAGGSPGASGSQFGLRRSALLLAATGCMGIVGQIVVLREMMAAYGGNELCAGVTLAVWMLSEALGAWSVGRAGKRRPVVGPLLFLSVLCSLAAVPAALLLRPLLGVLPGETLSIPLLLPATVLVALPPAATHGALFVTVAAAHAQYASVRDSSPSGVGSAYVWEGVGTAVAGLVCFLLLNHLSSLSLVALAALLLAAAGACSSPMARPERTMLGAGAGVLALAAILALGPTAEKLAWARAWRGQRVTELTNSAYGKMTRLERAGQQFILYNGRPALTMPLLETERREELGLIPVLAHPLPRRVLVLGHDLALAVTMARCFAEVEVTAVQLDPLLAQVLRAALASESQLPPNLHLLVADPVSFLSSGRDSFDCLVLTDAVPLSLGDCRLFTSEFYRLCRSRLSSRGLLATSCPGSPTGLSPDLLGLLSTRRRTLEVAFEHVLPLAVDFPLLLASRRPVQVAGEDLVARLGRLACRPRLLDSGYVVALLAPFRQ